MGFTCVLCQSVLNGDEILQRLGHFAAGDRQVSRVQEVSDPVVILEERLRGLEPELKSKTLLLNQLVHKSSNWLHWYLRLSQLVVVMGESQIKPPTVDVHGLAQDGAGHGGTFDVPARPPLTPR